jgi:transcriptional regulator with XRE-family HTH domain
METFGSRLKSERTRLGMTQEAFGAACDRGNIMQMNYEKGKGFPDLPYLLKAAELGVDLNFLITGRHSVECLREDETRLVAEYRTQNQQGKAAILGALLGMASVGSGADMAEVPESVLREFRIISLLRTCSEDKQIIFEEVARAFSDDPN